MMAALNFALGDVVSLLRRKLPRAYISADSIRYLFNCSYFDSHGRDRCHRR